MFLLLNYLAISTRFLQLRASYNCSLRISWIRYLLMMKYLYSGILTIKSCSKRIVLVFVNTKFWIYFGGCSVNFRLNSLKLVVCCSVENWTKGQWWLFFQLTKLFKVLFSFPSLLFFFSRKWNYSYIYYDLRIIFYIIYMYKCKGLYM